MKITQLVDSPEDFTTPFLANLDSSFRCSICQELFTAPVLLTRCSHTFCSLCIRSALNSTAGPSSAASLNKKCPICKVEADASHLKQNRAVGVSVEAWRIARPVLLASQADADLNSTVAHTFISPGTTKLHLVAEDDSSEDEIRATSTRSSSSRPANPKRTTKPPHAPLAKKSKRIENGKGKGKSDDDDPDVEIMGPDDAMTDPDLRVTCPMCEGEFKNGSLSRHIDVCDGVSTKQTSVEGWASLMGGTQASARGSSKKKSATAVTKRKAIKSDSPEDYPGLNDKRITTISYTGMTLSALTKKLNDLHLTSCLGNGKPLTLEEAIRRHRHYTTLWNSNLDFQDLQDPKRKSPASLKKELLVWEKLQDQVAKVIVGTRAEHQIEYAEHFRALTRSAKESAAKMRIVVTSHVNDEYPAPSRDDDSQTVGDKVRLQEMETNFAIPVVPHRSLVTTRLAIPLKSHGQEGEDEPFDWHGPRPSQRVKEDHTFPTRSEQQEDAILVDRHFEE